MTVIGPRLIVDAVHSFLTTTVGVTTLSLNDEVKAYRTQESLGTAQLPDVVTFQKYVYLGSQLTTQTPYLAIVWEGSDGETANNSRELPHRLSMYLLITDGNIAGNEEYMAGRLLDYVAVVQGMFLRATVAGSKGYTLNNGTGTTVGRILRATIDDVEFGTDDDLNDANVVIRFGLSVTSIEDYPGT